jgi:hypothetical protein
VKRCWLSRFGSGCGTHHGAMEALSKALIAAGGPSSDRVAQIKLVRPVDENLAICAGFRSARLFMGAGDLVEPTRLAAVVYRVRRGREIVGSASVPGERRGLPCDRRRDREAATRMASHLGGVQPPLYGLSTVPGSPPSNCAGLLPASACGTYGQRGAATANRIGQGRGNRR